MSIELSMSHQQRVSLSTKRFTRLSIINLHVNRARLHNAFLFYVNSTELRIFLLHRSFVAQHKSNILSGIENNEAFFCLLLNPNPMSWNWCHTCHFQPIIHRKLASTSYQSVVEVIQIIVNRIICSLIKIFQKFIDFLFQVEIAAIHRLFHDVIT